MNNRNVLMYPDDGTGGGGGAPAGGAPAGGAPDGGQPPAGGQPSGAPAGQPDIRAEFTSLVGDAKLVDSLPEDRIAALYPVLKGKFEEAGKNFPAEWRKMVSGDSPEHLKTLERFASPKALYDSYAALRSKLSSGELRPVSAFPAKGTAEEQSAWRQTNGVPENAEGYKFTVPQNVNLTDSDKETLKSIQGVAFEKHVPLPHAQAMADWYLGEKQARTEKRMQADEAFRNSSEDALHAEYGNDFRPNMNRVNALFDTGPKGMREMLGKARLADGSLLGDHPDFVRFFVDISRQIIPSGVVLPGAGADIGKSIGDEIAVIEKTMQTNRKAYNADEKMQARYRELLGARDRMGGGKKAA